MHVHGRAIIQNFKYCNEYHELKMGPNVTHGDTVHCEKNEGDGKNRVLCVTLEDTIARTFREFFVSLNEKC